MVTAVATPEIGSFIDGAWRTGGATVADTSPAAPSESVADVSQATEVDAAQAVEAAERAFPGWRSTPAPARADILRRAGDLLADRAAEIGRDLTREEGKTIGEATRETALAAQILRYHAGLAYDADG